MLLIARSYGLLDTALYHSNCSATSWKLRAFSLVQASPHCGWRGPFEELRIVRVDMCLFYRAIECTRLRLSHAQARGREDGGRLGRRSSRQTISKVMSADRQSK